MTGGDTWTEVARTWEVLTRELAALGLPVRARLERAEGVLSAWRDGAVLIAPWSLDAPGDALRAVMLGGMMGTSPETAARLFRAMIPRLLGHELGHALRAEGPGLTDDHVAEEQFAERVGSVMMRRHAAPGDLAFARALLGEVTARLGGTAVAAGLHRHAERARRELGLAPREGDVEAAAAAFRRDYYTDVTAYLRVCVAWTWLDLSLDADGSLEDLARDGIG